jgi:hypothetical protein
VTPAAGRHAPPSLGWLRLLALLVVPTLLAAACGGSSPTVPAAAAPSSTTPRAAVSPSGKRGHVLARIVNLYAPPGHPDGVDVEAYSVGSDSPAAQEGVGKPDIGPVGYGKVSDYAPLAPSVTGDLVLFTPGVKVQVGTVNLDGVNPDRFTVQVWANGEGQFSASTFGERPSAENLVNRHTGAIPAAPSGKALLVAAAQSLGDVAKGKGYNLGDPAKGCAAVEPPDTSGSHPAIPAGGALQYTVSPGAQQAAYFDILDDRCTTVVIPPVPLTVQAGDRAYVIAYGTTPANLRLMVLPIPVLPGDPPLLAPKPSATPIALDPCRLVSKPDAAAAMGGPVTDTKDDVAAGTCEYDGAGTTVSVALQTDFSQTVFDAAKSASSGPVTVSGLGDAAYSTTQPVNSLFVMKGKTFVAIGLNRHVDGGQDDPGQDGPILSGLMTKALNALP